MLDYAQLRKHYERLANEDVKREQHACRHHRIQHLIEQADLNPRWTFENLDVNDPLLATAIGTARSFVDGFQHWENAGGRGLFIYGDYGTGKSTIAGAIAHDLFAITSAALFFSNGPR